MSLTTKYYKYLAMSVRLSITGVPEVQCQQFWAVKLFLAMREFKTARGIFARLAHFLA